MEGARRELTLRLLCVALVLSQALCQQPGSPSVIRIDCGSALSSIVNGHIWMPDTNFVGGKAAVVSSVGALQGALNPIEDTLRAFPSDTGGCYTVPVVPWRYLVRVGFAYYNFDGRNSPPTFNVTLQGSPVATMFMVQYETGARMGQGAVYKDFITPAWHGIVRVCVRPFQSRYSALQANASSTPLINSVEILPVDAQAYDEKRTMLSDILATAVRINLGGPGFGPDPGDPSFRIWQKDELPMAPGLVMTAPPGIPIAGALSPPDFLPSQIFSTARLASQVSGGAFALQLPIWPMNLAHDYLMRVYVSEIQAGVNKPGMRVFDIVVGATMPDGSLVRLNEPSKFDILSVAPPFTAVSLTYALTLRNLPTYSQALVIGVQTLQGSRFPGLMCGLELFEIIPVGELNNTAAPGTTPQPQPGQHPRAPGPQAHKAPPPHHPPPKSPSPPLMFPPVVISSPPPLPLLYPPPLYPNGQINTNGNSAPSTSSSSSSGSISTGALVAVILICTLAGAAAIGLITWLIIRSRNNDDVDAAISAAASVDNSPKAMYSQSMHHPMSMHHQMSMQQQHMQQQHMQQQHMQQQHMQQQHMQQQHMQQL